MKRALVITGAGAKGILEAGMCQGFAQAGLSYDYLIGTSSGALTAAFLHSDQLDVIIDVWLHIKNHDVYSWAPWKMLTKEACIFDNAPLKKLIAKNLDIKKLKANPAKLVVNATDLSTWSIKAYELAALPDDQIVDALVASTAVPGVFPMRNGLCDGGLIDDYPLLDAVAMKADEIVVFAPSIIEGALPNNFNQALSKSVSVLLYSQLINALRAVPADVKLTVIQPEKALDIGLLDFNSLGNYFARSNLVILGADLARRKLTPCTTLAS